jgi:hypothetical protein
MEGCKRRFIREVGGSKCRPVVIITHDESIFSANDGKHQAWVPENGTILRPKGKGKGIMVSDFLLPWSRLNLLSLPRTRQQELLDLGIPLEAAVFFEYGQEEGYWDGKMLVQQAVSKALPIAEALYPGYSFLFLFDNATNHSSYADDALIASKMNKTDGGQQPFLRSCEMAGFGTVISYGIKPCGTSGRILREPGPKKALNVC